MLEIDPHRFDQIKSIIDLELDSTLNTLNNRKLALKNETESYYLEKSQLIKEIAAIDQENKVRAKQIKQEQIKAIVKQSEKKMKIFRGIVEKLKRDISIHGDY